MCYAQQGNVYRGYLLARSLSLFNNYYGMTSIFSAFDIYTLPGCGVCGQDVDIGPVMDIGGYWNQMFISTL